MKMKIKFIYSPNTEGRLDFSMIKEAIMQFSELPEIYKKIVVLVADENAINKGFFEQNEEELFGKIPVSLTEAISSISSSSLPQVGCIKINLNKFNLFPEWKKEFAVRHECCHLLTTSVSSRTIQELLKAYSFSYLRDIIRYRREFVAHICMLKHYPYDWLREPIRIPEKIESPRTFYRKIKKEKGVRAAVEVAISNSVKVLSLIYIYEYLMQNVKNYDYVELKKDLMRYKSYLQSWQHHARRDTNDKMSPIENWIKKEDFLSEEAFVQKVTSLLNFVDKIFPRIGSISEGWNPSASGLAKAIRLIEDYFEKRWLQDQIKVISYRPREWHKKFSHHLKPEPHSIPNLYMKALENLKFLKEDPNIGFQRETLELMSFCDTLNAIKEIDIVDISGKRVAINPWTKFKERLRNKDEFRQALYEMQIAVALKRSGFKTFFIQESAKKGEKTSDLLVEDNGKPIHIECKYRGPTHREQQYDNTFKEFYSRSMRLMHHLGKFYFVCVEWLKDPSIEHLESEISGLERRLSNGEQGYFETKNIKIWLKQLASKEQVFEGCYSFDISGYKSDDNHADIIMQKADIGIFDGVPKYKNPTLVMFRNISYMDDLVNGIIELLNKAYPQIPEKSPGIIFIEARVSFLNQRIKETLQDLERRLIGKLKLTERVNMVILTKSAFMERNIRVNEKDAKIIARVVESRMIPNRKPKSPISQDLLKRLRTLKFY